MILATFQKNLATFQMILATFQTILATFQSILATFQTILVFILAPDDSFYSSPCSFQHFLTNFYNIQSPKLHDATCSLVLPQAPSAKWSSLEDFLSILLNRNTTTVVVCFFACLMSQQHGTVSQGRICTILHAATQR